jgi:hypothetical protein
MFSLPFDLPKGDPSTTSQLLSGHAPTGEPVVSVVFGMVFDVLAGRCAAKRGFTIQQELAHAPADVASRLTRPSLLTRDVDTYVWRNLTDLVIRGTARSERRVESLEVKLTVTGSQKPFERRIAVTGDRVLDEGPSGLTLSTPVPFTEMPMRYDKAYGGTDEVAEAMFEDAEYLQMLRLAAGDDAAEISEYSYPRNPAGKGYAIAPQSLVELPWPNLEFPEERLSPTLEAVVRPRTEWGLRPYPAAFDWFPHGWFPRCAFFADFPETHDGGYPPRELELGLFKPGEERLSWFDRPKASFANGAHPYLARRRFRGDEAISVTHMSKDGRTFEAKLPEMKPRVAFRFLGQTRNVVDASLDLVLLDTDASELTMLWRATMMHTTENLPIDWIEKSPYEVLWG